MCEFILRQKNNKGQPKQFGEAEEVIQNLVESLTQHSKNCLICSLFFLG